MNALFFDFWGQGWWLAAMDYPTPSIMQIPGFDDAFPSKHYSGYVTIDEKNGKKLFYYFFQSQGNPSEDPVVLWLNGGPGCSSFDGFVYEHGPFSFEAANASGSLPKLHLNPHSWTKAGIEERLQQMTADFENRMAGLVQAELAKMMPNLPPEFRPPTHPPGDDATSTV